jgi:ubiquitin C-terminal hydrolase
MNLSDVITDSIKIYSPETRCYKQVYNHETGCYKQLSFTEKNGWEVVDLHWIQKDYLRKFLPGCILRLIGLAHVANTQSSYLYAKRSEQTGELGKEQAEKINKIFSRKFFALDHFDAKLETPKKQKLVEKETQTSEPTDEKPVQVQDIKPRALIRTGNNCYMVSMMQVLMNNQTFIKKFYEVKEWPRDPKGQAVVECLGRFIDAYCSSEVSDEEVEESLIKLKEELNLGSSHLTGGVGAQQDANCVLMYLLDILEIKFRIRQTIKPSEGSYPSSIKIDPMNLITVDFKDTLDESLELFFNATDIEYQVEPKKPTVSATKSFQLDELPEILPIFIKRYKSDLSKESGPISTTAKINLSVYLTYDFKDLNSCEYEVESVILHTGGLEGGHYIAQVCKDGQWYECNDQSVRPIDQPDLANAYGYIFKRVATETSKPKGIKRQGNTCYLNAFFQSMFAIDSIKKSPRLMELKKQHSEMSEDAFLEEVIKEREAIYNLAGQTTNWQKQTQDPKLDMQTVEDLIPRWIEHYGLEKLTSPDRLIQLDGVQMSTPHTVPMIHFGLKKQELLHTALLAKLERYKGYKLPAILPVSVNSEFPTTIHPDQIVQFGGMNYRLRSAIIHGSAHYTAVVLKQGQWYHCNDLTIEPVHESILSNAQIFFYEAI